MRRSIPFLVYLHKMMESDPGAVQAETLRNIFGLKYEDLFLIYLKQDCCW